ncbi:MAG: hypothetical protein MJ067_00970 [Oscillospiraceae bacterium]|nr:hypothetical protein [Oscillospiraceae bacterium]
MDDRAIVQLYLERNEKAINITAEKYGKKLRSIAYGITEDNQASEECENDTYLAVWNSIPPNKPIFSLIFQGLQGTSPLITAADKMPKNETPRFFPFPRNLKAVFRQMILSKKKLMPENLLK